MVDLTEKPEETPSNHQSSDIVDAIVHATVSYCNEHNADNPTEILRCFQQQFVTGRALEVASEDDVNKGEGILSSDFNGKVFFDHGLRELMREKYVPVGIVLGELLE